MLNLRSLPIVMVRMARTLLFLTCLVLVCFSNTYAQEQGKSEKQEKIHTAKKVRLISEKEVVFQIGFFHFMNMDGDYKLVPGTFNFTFVKKKRIRFFSTGLGVVQKDVRVTRHYPSGDINKYETKTSLIGTFYPVSLILSNDNEVDLMLGIAFGKYGAGPIFGLSIPF